MRRERLINDISLVNFRLITVEYILVEITGNLII